METEAHILIVDDDNGIRDLLGQFLQKHGFKTSPAKNSEEMHAVFNKVPVDLVILDIMLPGEDGITICRKLRQTTDIPIIMLTAISEEVDRILSLEMGADDYLSKPFNPRELLARIKAILRRVGVGASQESELPYDAAIQDMSLHFDGWVLETATRRLFSPDQVEISLSNGEYLLLRALLERSMQVLSRDQLMELTKNREAGPLDRSIDIQISRLRGKLERDPKQPELIKTVRGGGYMFAVSAKRVHSESLADAG